MMAQEEHDLTTLLLKKPQQSPDESKCPVCSIKYIKPKITHLLELNILNNTSGSGDGDAAQAHS